jgi:hypothetical protein
MRWTQRVLKTRAPLADGEDVWSWRLEVGVKLAEFFSAGDGVKQTLITGESTG